MSPVVPRDRITGSTSQAPSLGAIALAFRRYRFTFLVIFAFCLLVGAVAIATSDRQYVATAQVSVSSGRTELMPDPAATPKAPTPLNELVDSEAEVIRSRSVADAVIARERLQDDRELLGATVPSASREAALHNMVAARLEVRRVDLTNVLNIRFRSADPAKATRLANSFASAYIAQQLANKIAATQDANAWLRGSIAKLRQQTLAASAAVERYKIEHNLLSANGATLTEQEISNLNEQNALAGVQAAEADARLAAARAQLRQSGSGDTMGESLQSPVVQQLRQQSADLSRQMADLSTRYGDNYPAVANVRRQLDDVNRSIAAENARVAANLESQSSIARQRRSAVDSSVSVYRARLAANNAASVKLQELTDLATASRNQYEAMLARYNQSAIREATERPDAQIVSNAMPPLLPSYPNIPLLLAFSIVQGICLGSAGVLLRRVMEKGLLSARDVEDQLGIAPLATIPVLARGDRATGGADAILGRQRQPYTEALRGLWVSLQQRQRDGAIGRSILFTSALPGEGKTTLAVSLARLLAVDGARVLVIDLDLRRRGATTLLGGGGPGANAFLAGDADFSALIRHETASGLDFIAAGEDMAGEPSETVISALLEEAASRYRIVIIDGPPVLPVAWCRVLARHVGETVLVARWRKTPTEIVRTTLRMLTEASANVQGLALTMVDPRFARATGHGDPARYQKLFKSYYSS